MYIFQNTFNHHCSTTMLAFDLLNYSIVSSCQQDEEQYFECYVICYKNTTRICYKISGYKTY